MKVPLRDLPHSVEGAYCWRMAIACVMEIDPYDVPEILGSGWFYKYMDWAASRGWHMEDWCLCGECDYSRSKPKPEIKSGIVSVDCGTDQFHHAIVIKDGALFYDPAHSGVDGYFSRRWMRFTRLERLPR